MRARRRRVIRRGKIFRNRGGKMMTKKKVLTFLFYYAYLFLGA